MVFLTGLALLLSGSPLLLVNLAPHGYFPLGTLSTWAALVALPASIMFGCIGLFDPQDKFTQRLNILLKTNVLFGLLWGFTAYLAAANWAINFQPVDAFRGSPEAAAYFWPYTALLVCLSVLALIVYVIRLAYRRFVERGVGEG